MRWSWPLLLRGRTPVDVQLYGLDARLDLTAPWSVSPADHPPAAPEPLAGLGPLRSFTLADSSLEIVLLPDLPPIPLLTGLRATLRQGAWGTTDDALTVQLEIVAHIAGGGPLAVQGALSPVLPQGSWTLRFALDRLPLRPFNPIFLKVIEMDVERGALSLHGQLTATRGRLRGLLQPNFYDLELLAPRERVRHPMAEAIFSSMLATSDAPILLDRPLHPEASAPRMTLDDAFKADAMDLLSQLILTGFTRRLDSLIGHDATIGGLELDLARGVMAFTDVTLRKTGGTAEAAYVQIDRLEVIVETSVTDDSIETFKAIILHRPRLTLITGRIPSESQLEIDPEWQTKISTLPYPTDSVHIVDGQLEYRDETTSPPSRFVVSGLQLTAANLGRAARTPTRRAATISARGLLMGDGLFELGASFAPASPQLDGELRLVIDPVQLTRFNGLLRSHAGVDVSAGTLGMFAVMDIHEGHLTGALTPDLAEVSVLGVDEEFIQHPIRELIIERRLRRLRGLTLHVDLHVRDNLFKELPRALLAALREAK